jgi:putative PIN family toxin of toxin-antitoxin system
MIRVVLDANTLASGAMAHPGTTLAEIIDRWVNEEYDVLLSQEILIELRHTFATPYFTARLSAQDRTDYLTLVPHLAVIIPITTHVAGIATHTEDDVILATAVSTQAHYLLTGDIQLQRLATYKGIRILSPSAFLEQALKKAAA